MSTVYFTVYNVIHDKLKNSTIQICLEYFQNSLSCKLIKFFMINDPGTCSDIVLSSEEPSASVQVPQPITMISKYLATQITTSQLPLYLICPYVTWEKAFKLFLMHECNTYFSFILDFGLLSIYLDVSLHALIGDPKALKDLAEHLMSVWKMVYLC